MGVVEAARGVAARTRSSAALALFRQELHHWSVMAAATPTCALRDRRGATAVTSSAATTFTAPTFTATTFTVTTLTAGSMLIAAAVRVPAAEAAPFAAARRADPVVTAPVAIVVSIGFIDPVVIGASSIAVGSDGARRDGQRHGCAEGTRREVTANGCEQAGTAIHFGSAIVSLVVHSMIPNGAP
jgi:hypothetical protein